MVCLPPNQLTIAWWGRRYLQEYAMAGGDEGDGPGAGVPAAHLSGLGAVAAAADPAVREELRGYLRHQSELVVLQIEESRREDSVRHWSLRIRHVSDVLKLGFELAIAFIVLVVAAGLGLIV